MRLGYNFSEAVTWYGKIKILDLQLEITFVSNDAKYKHRHARP